MDALRAFPAIVLILFNGDLGDVALGTVGPRYVTVILKQKSQK
jgi:hypothetical protein